MLSFRLPFAHMLCQRRRQLVNLPAAFNLVNLSENERDGERKRGRDEQERVLKDWGHNEPANTLGKWNLLQTEDFEWETEKETERERTKKSVTHLKQKSESYKEITFNYQ